MELWRAAVLHSPGRPLLVLCREEMPHFPVPVPVSFFLFSVFFLLPSVFVIFSSFFSLLSLFFSFFFHLSSFFFFLLSSVFLLQVEHSLKEQKGLLASCRKENKGSGLPFSKGRGRVDGLKTTVPFFEDTLARLSGICCRAEIDLRSATSPSNTLLLGDIFGNRRAPTQLP